MNTKSSILKSKNISETTKSCGVYIEKTDDHLEREKGGSNACNALESSKPSQSLQQFKSRFMESVKLAAGKTIEEQFDRIDQRIYCLIQAVCELDRKVNCIHKDICSKVIKYGRECFLNCDKLQQSIGENSEQEREAFNRFHYFAEVDDSDFDVVENSEGSTSYEICLPECAFNVVEDPNSQSGDFILKIRPTHTESLSTYIKIPAEQMNYNFDDEESCEHVTIPKHIRASGGSDQKLENLWEMVFKMEERLRSI